MRVITGNDALDMMRANKLRLFPSRSRGAERLFPFARPQVTLPRPLPENPKFFVIGNCFARGVEKALAEADFEVLSSSYVPDLPGDAIEQFQRFNKFNVDSSINEILWATGLRDDLDSALVAVDDEMSDMQLHYSISFPPAQMREIRRAYNATFAAVTEADVVILTTGPHRQWYDRQADLYLNAMPTRKMMTEHPERFEVHELTVADAEARIENAVAVLRQVAPQAQVVLVASPVYQPSTIGMGDALTDQVMGKALMRMAIEHVIARQPDVGYLPALEAVWLSDFKSSFLANSANHTTADLAERMTAALLAAGGLTDRRQKWIAGQGYGAALIRAGEIAQAIAVLEEALLGDDGQLDPAGVGKLSLHNMYMHALQQHGLRVKAFQHGLAVLRADNADERIAKRSDLQAAKAERGMSHMDTLFGRVTNIGKAVATKEEMAFCEDYAARHGLNISRGVKASVQTLGGMMAPLEAAIQAKNNDNVVKEALKLIGSRAELNHKERDRLDQVVMTAHLAEGQDASAGVELLLDAHAATPMSPKILVFVGNQVKGRARLVTLERFIEVARQEVGYPAARLEQLVQRRDFLVARQQRLKSQ